MSFRAYILHNTLTHRRFLPVESKHSFQYSTISLLLSLDALEKHELDLCGGWLFGYRGLWGRVTGIRPSAYLHSSSSSSSSSIRSKLEAVLSDRGLPGSELQDAWLMTMPSFLGYEGINPLSVYFCYRRGSPQLWLVILETHNTFGERHVDVLETGKTESVPRQTAQVSIDHQWKIPRQFHVSPFNDRSGHYLCQIAAPSHPPFPHESTPADCPPPRPIVKLTLLTATATAPPRRGAQAKLSAMLQPTRSTPLSSISLSTALARAPLSLSLTFPRILYNAYVLHYTKRLDVYMRPDPQSSDLAVEARLPAVVRNPVQPSDDARVGGGVGWQPEGLLESWCKRRVCAFLRRRCAAKSGTGTTVTFVPSNPFQDRIVIGPIDDDDDDGDGETSAGAGAETALTVYYRSPRLFTVLFTMPSAEYALLYGSEAERIFSVSSKDLFLTVFAKETAAALSSMTTRSKKKAAGGRFKQKLAARLRRSFGPPHTPTPTPLGPFNLTHALDDDPIGLVPLLVLFLLWVLSGLERRVFAVLGARYVSGDEPWNGWQRLYSSSEQYPGAYLGSVRRD